jgi:dolichyl-phosphate beta-glucosyltransferase
MRSEFISVIIPAYNEQERISSTLDRIHGLLSTGFSSFEIIVVDDGSTDGTAAVVTKAAESLPGVRLIKMASNAGKGAAVRSGVLSCSSDLVLISDADMSTPIEEVDKLLAALDSGSDMAIGSRAMPGSELTLRQSFIRQTMGKTFNFLVRLLVISGISDTQCGFKLMRGDAARRLFAKSTINGFSFDVEVLCLAKKMGLKILEVPVRWHNSPDSKVRMVRDSARMMIDLFLIRLRLGRTFHK